MAVAAWPPQPARQSRTSRNGYAADAIVSRALSGPVADALQNLQEAGSVLPELASELCNWSLTGYPAADLRRIHWLDRMMVEAGVARRATFT
jgi:hypothetical protein